MKGQWCCPKCGALNDAEGEFSGVGFCQGARCVAARGDLVEVLRIRFRGMPAIPIQLTPEIFAAFDKEWASA